MGMVSNIPSFQVVGKYEMSRQDWYRAAKRVLRLSIFHWIKAAKMLSRPGLLKGDMLRNAVFTS